jgi:hypothetical protein
MTPWINPTTKKGYCPTQSDYNSPVSNPVFKVLREVVGVDTEAFYYGVHAPEQLMDRAGNRYSTPEVRMLIRESLLKRIWFYLDNGRPTEPDVRRDENNCTIGHDELLMENLPKVNDYWWNLSGSMRTSVTDRWDWVYTSEGQ